MQRTNRIVLGLIAVFVLGGSLVLLSCGGDDDDTTDINAGNAASQLGNRQYTFSTLTDFGVTVFSTLAFNANADRFALLAGGSSAVGSVTYGSCIFTVDRNFGAGSGLQVGPAVVVNTCQTDQSNNNNLILNDATSTGNAFITVPVNFNR